MEGAPDLNPVETPVESAQEPLAPESTEGAESLTSSRIFEAAVQSVKDDIEKDPQLRPLGYISEHSAFKLAHHAAYALDPEYHRHGIGEEQMKEVINDLQKIKEW